MLTEKECENVLSENKIYLKNQMLKKERISHSVYLLNTVTSLLERLIHEHFSNPPLKFDELNKGYPIYDNDEIVCGWKIIYMIDKQYKQLLLIDEEGNVGWVNYEENRFYRKEVQE